MKVKATKLSNNVLELTDNDFKNVIANDCAEWEKLKNKDEFDNDYMYLNEYNNSNQNGFYQLILNGEDFWYGTLVEINAVVKTMITLLIKERKDEIRRRTI